MYDACRRANILDVIESKPGGFYAMIGTEYKGVDFSKGEKQRLALAARLYAKLPFTLLDEPDASLDATSKKVVINGILQSDSTVVIVIHNLLACEQCDMVAFVKDGKIIESGTHKELLELEGEYSRMFNDQVNNKEDRKIKKQVLEPVFA